MKGHVMSTIGIIPVRAHSSRFPNKTWAEVNGESLLRRTIRFALASKLNDLIVVSSCEKVYEYCKKIGVNYRYRPKGFETDKAPIIDTISWLNGLVGGVAKYDYQMLLQLTNPLRTTIDINACMSLIETFKGGSVCSVTPVKDHHPYRMFKQAIGLGLVPMFKDAYQQMRTQDLPKVYLRDGSIYLWRTDRFDGKTLLPERIVRYEVQPSRSIRVDTPADLEQVQNYLDNYGASC